MVPADEEFRKLTQFVMQKVCLPLRMRFIFHSTQQ